jgi:IMP dehydrogenase
MVMPTVAAVLKDKAAGERPSEVHVIGPAASVLDAARLMNEKHIGSLAVIDEKGTLAGIITERDVLVRVVAAERSPQDTPVSAVMTSPVIAVPPETKTDAVQSIMRQKRVRHIPVVENDALVGMISIGDLNRIDARVMHETITYLEQYIYKPT